MASSRKDGGAGKGSRRRRGTPERPRNRDERKIDRATPLRPPGARPGHGSTNLSEDSLAGREDSRGREDED